MTTRRLVPSIDRLRQRPAVKALEARFGAAATLDALRAGADVARRSIAELDDRPAIPGSPLPSEDDIARRIETLAGERLAGDFRPSLRRVINATGIIVHTNLGRAPLSPRALDRLIDVARGYSTLEYDLGRGERGRRDTHAEQTICRLTGAEAAVVVNNNAAAALLVLAALASGREVIVSRGELVEIGGGFRVPDVMTQSGARLREVGTTNKTRASDYAAAVTDQTALILRVHPSNFRIEGFTERPSLTDLVALGSRLRVPVVEDLGSGHMGLGTDHPLHHAEPTVQSSVGAGVDLCCFSGDKLLGGPQAGVIVGKAVHVDRIRRHPLMRALRVDKLTYAALEATLVEYLVGRAEETVPVQRMLALTADAIRGRAQLLAERLSGEQWRVEVVPGVSAVGGGSAPGVELPTWLLAVEHRHLNPDQCAATLRQQSPPVIARIEHGRLLLDLRTVDDEDDILVAELLAGLSA
jgi:L-seryl-tRNA(Ser) seleniumtransferase